MQDKNTASFVDELGDDGMILGNAMLGKYRRLLRNVRWDYAGRDQLTFDRGKVFVDSIVR